MSYRDLALPAMASVFGWGLETNYEGKGSSTIGVYTGNPVGGRDVVYTTGVATEAYVVGAASGPELLFAGNLEVQELSRGVRAAASTLVMRDLAPSVGSVIHNFVHDMGWSSQTVRHAFFVPPMFWGQESYRLPVPRGEGGGFRVVPALQLLLTDDELALYKAQGWDKFDQMMAESEIDILDLMR